MLSNTTRYSETEPAAQVTDRLGDLRLAQAAGGDEVFARLALARITEPASRLAQ